MVNANATGNRCGHQPHMPRLIPLKPLDDSCKKRPLILRRLATRIQEYYERPGMLPSLCFAGSIYRRQRSERREACVRTLSVLIKFLDLKTLCVGIPQRVPGTDDVFFTPLTVHVLAAHIGFPVRRVSRALSDLACAGIITSSQPRLMDEHGNYKGLAAVRAVSKDLFGAFGLLSMLEKERHKRARSSIQQQSHLRREYHTITKTAKARGGLMLKAMVVQSRHRSGASDPFLTVPARITPPTPPDTPHRSNDPIPFFKSPFSF